MTSVQPLLQSAARPEKETSAVSRQRLPVAEARLLAENGAESRALLEQLQNECKTRPLT